MPDDLRREPAVGGVAVPEHVQLALLVGQAGGDNALDCAVIRRGKLHAGARDHHAASAVAECLHQVRPSYSLDELDVSGLDGGDQQLDLLLPDAVVERASHVEGLEQSADVAACRCPEVLGGPMHPAVRRQTF